MNTTSRLWLITAAIAMGSLLLSLVVYFVFDVVFIFFLFIPPAVYWLLRRSGSDGNVRD
jgi:membrane protein implicated in regulation of membrane protease activity